MACLFVLYKTSTYNVSTLGEKECLKGNVRLGMGREIEFMVRKQPLRGVVFKKLFQKFIEKHMPLVTLLTR